MYSLPANDVDIFTDRVVSITGLIFYWRVVKVTVT